jgi:hypothetical protein
MPLPEGSVVSYTEPTWAEDKATRGRDPSADPGAKTGVGSMMLPLGNSGIGQKAINWDRAETPRHFRARRRRHSYVTAYLCWERTHKNAARRAS